jgi:hypothetical protein
MRSFNAAVYTKVVELLWDITNNIDYDENEITTAFEVHYYTEDIYKNAYIVYFIKISTKTTSEVVDDGTTNTVTSKNSYILTVDDMYNILNFIPLMKVVDFRVEDSFGMVDINSKIYKYSHQKMKSNSTFSNAFEKYQLFNDAHLAEFSGAMIDDIKTILTDYGIEFTDDGDGVIMINSEHTQMCIPYASFNKITSSIIQPNIVKLDGYHSLGIFVKHQNKIPKYTPNAIIINCPKCDCATIINWGLIDGSICLSCGERVNVKWVNL